MTPHTPPHSLGLLLIEGFALMSYASVIEPFRAANNLAGEELYRWTHISVDGEPVRASNGALFFADEQVGTSTHFDTLFLFAAGDPLTFADKPTFAWLRKIARLGTRIAGISGGPFLMARAGLLDGYSATIHWEHRIALQSGFPDLMIEPSLYVIDRARITCAGGTAGLDLAIDLIERDHSPLLARRVGEWFIQTEHRNASKPQRPSLSERFGVRDERVVRALAVMEKAMEHPSPVSEIAAAAYVSARQLERLFHRHLGKSISAVYLDVRLDRAAQLLHQTAASTTTIALMCGFRSASHFSTAFRRRFAISPSHFRKQESL
ncbi:MAG: GlxA family transcriptional regulator [Sphingobium sp.]|jgi:transcriptional regulator GlxA family with amidase domain|nr:GlxA family transcriptional regulator [Sphingobium sp.]MCI1270888.1 GlxA family transcriptional regulator [Sphingobium sp.]MCI1755785.1 GlxA family transcriptional regulator [Sphingobium sp.]MCI2053089.1 GlxA family transcriptional regulator [Sphingobium sp.]